MLRKLLVAGLAGLALIVLAALAASMFIDVNQFRPALERQFESAVGRKVSLGHITLSLLAGNVSVENVSIADDARFSATPFVTAKAVKVGVELWPLIASRSLRVRSFTLEEPQILLRRSTAGTWNFSTVGASPPSGPVPPSARAGEGVPDLSIRKLAVSNGRISVAAPGARGRDRVYDGVNIEASNVSYTSPFPFRLDAKTPGGGTVHMEGKAGPLDATDASATPIDANVEVKQLDLATTGVIDPTSGLAGVIDFSGTLASNGREARSKGTLSARKLRVVQGGAPADVPVQVGYESTYDLKRRAGTIRQGDVHIGSALARLTGSFKTEAETTAVRLKIAGHQMPVPAVEAALPAVGVTLPAGASLKGGTLDLDLDVNGPVERLVTVGTVSVVNTTLTGFDLGSKMAVVAAFAGIPRSADTAIQTFRSTVRVAPEGIRADALELLVPAIGRLTGGGTVASQGALDFKMLAQLAGSSGISGTVSRVASLGHPENGTPFLIRGTTSNPTFAPDVAAAVRGAVNKETVTKAASGLLKGLFNKKR